LCSFACLDDGSLGDEDTIEELTLVLGSNLADLADLGAAEGEGSLVDTFEDKLVLGLNGDLDSASGLHNNLLDLATTEEVLDLNGLVVLGNDSVNGEMSVNESHLVEDTLKPRIVIINKLDTLKGERQTHRHPTPVLG